MITTVHVRGGDRAAVVAAVTRQMEREGYVLDMAAGETHERAFGVPAIRAIDVVEGGGWVSLIDHPFANTAWAKILSSEIPLPVVELAGERDHAFFSTAVLFEGGEERGVSRVPEDAVLEEDGRHRIRPVFFAAVAPDARTTLEAGLVVHPRGGEENIVKVGRTLGIARPLVRTHWDEEPELRLVFRRVRETAAAGSRLGFEALVAQLGASLAPEERAQLDALLHAPPAVEPKLFVQLAQTGKSVGSSDGGLEIRVSVSSSLPEARGITIDLAGEGVALLEPSLEASMWFGREWAPITGERDGDVVRFRPDVVLAATPRALPAGFVTNLAAMPENERAEVLVRVPSALPRAGRGLVRLTVRTTAPGDVVEEESIEVAVAAALRMPVLPSAVTLPLLPHMHEEYAARASLEGWVGFGAPWSDVAARVTPMLRDLVATLRRATTFALDAVRVETSTHESLEFSTTLDARDGTWQKIEAELMRGASLHVDGLDEGYTIDGVPEPTVSITLTHNRDGGFVGWPAIDGAGNPIDRPRVTLAWRLSRPPTAEGRALVAEISRRILLDAGHVSGQLGGFVSSNGTAYEHFAGTHRLAQKQGWLAEHVRTPAWCVLAPSAAAAKLGDGSARVCTSRTTHGLFAWSTATDPFAYGDADAEAMERFVLPAIGTS